MKSPAKNDLSKTFQLDPALRDYAVLKSRVQEVFIRGRERIEREFTRIRFCTGLLINEHVRLNKDRAAYGAKAVLRLEKDFGIDHTELFRYAQFAKAYPIVGGRRQLAFKLPWTHYRKLMTIQDDGLRYQLTEQAEANEWSFEKIEAKVRAVVPKSRNGKPPVLPFVCLGPFGTYKMIRPEIIHSDSNELLVDFGFGHSVELAALSDKRFAEGSLVRAVQDVRGHYALEKIPAPQAEAGKPDDLLYTYKAYVEKVLDGDTLKVEFHLGFGKRQRETIRLNHIDCPELSTPEGRAAKRFVDSELAQAEWITVKSVRTRKEKWGRYLGNVFYEKKVGLPIYLNQLLLDKGYAVIIPSP